MEKFNYVIAKKWNEETDSLCCYAYGATVFYDNIEGAEATLNFIRGRVDDNSSNYEIYKIDDKPLKTVVMESDKSDK